jgi:hypothetical protein
MRPRNCRHAHADALERGGFLRLERGEARLLRGYAWHPPAFAPASHLYLGIAARDTSGLPRSRSALLSSAHCTGSCCQQVAAPVSHQQRRCPAYLLTTQWLMN